MCPVLNTLQAAGEQAYSLPIDHPVPVKQDNIHYILKNLEHLLTITFFSFVSLVH